MSTTTAVQRAREEAIDWAAIRADVRRIVAGRMGSADPAEIEDLTQEALLQLLQRIRRGGVQDPTRLAARIASRRAIDAIRARQRSRARMADLGDSRSVDDLAAPEPKELDGALQRVWSSIRDLLAADLPRGLVHLKGRLDGNPPRQIAERLGMSPEAERKVWSRCMRRIRILGAEDPRFFRLRAAVSEAMA